MAPNQKRLPIKLLPADEIIGTSKDGALSFSANQKLTAPKRKSTKAVDSRAVCGDISHLNLFSDKLMYTTSDSLNYIYFID